MAAVKEDLRAQGLGARTSGPHAPGIEPPEIKRRGETAVRARPGVPAEWPRRKKTCGPEARAPRLFLAKCALPGKKRNEDSRRQGLGARTSGPHVLGTEPLEIKRSGETAVRAGPGAAAEWSRRKKTCGPEARAPRLLHAKCALPGKKMTL